MTTVWVYTDHYSYRVHTYFCFCTEDNKTNRQTVALFFGKRFAILFRDKKCVFEQNACGYFALEIWCLTFIIIRSWVTFLHDLLNLRCWKCIWNKAASFGLHTSGAGA